MKVHIIQIKCMFMFTIFHFNSQSPSLTFSKIGNTQILFITRLFQLCLSPGAVLHLAIVKEDGAVKMIDVDINVPSFRCSNSGDYDGSIGDYKSFLTRTRPVGWRDEVAKQQSMSANAGSDATRSCRVKLVNTDTVLPSQVTRIHKNRISSG